MVVMELERKLFLSHRRKGRTLQCSTKTQRRWENLGQWLSDQKKQQKIGELKKDREEGLTSLGVEWASFQKVIY